MAKVSVIIPVYCVEKYIERCARSLFEQTLDDIEYIFVDDCSPDLSVRILNIVLDDYPHRKNQARIIRHEKNRGLAIARQTGINAATGDYIAHCDSDDWVDLDLYESLYEKGRSENLDVVVFNYKTTDGTNSIAEYSGGKFVDKNSCINAMMHRKMWWSLCNKMIKRDLYYCKELIYPKDAMGEDMCLTLQIFYFCQRIGYVDKYYNYFINPDSIIQQISEEKSILKFRQIVTNVGIVKRFYRAVGLFKQFYKGLNYLEFNSKKTIFHLLGQRCYYNLCLDTFNGCEKVVIFDNDARIKDRIKAVLLLLHLYPLFRKI